jgi:hypothetical protein
LHTIFYILGRAFKPIFVQHAGAQQIRQKASPPYAWFYEKDW